MRRIFIDTEWTAVPWSPTCDLLWIGLADEEGNKLCALNIEARVDPENTGYVADLLRLITPDVRRMSRAELSSAVQAFCAGMDELWAWVPTVDSFAAWSGLGDSSIQVYRQCRDIDLQMLRSLVQPWPSEWPGALQDLNAASLDAGVALPPRAKNHLHPHVHAEWNRLLFSLIDAKRHRSGA
jgi:hypothetical protein